MTTAIVANKELASTLASWAQVFALIAGIFAFLRFRYAQLEQRRERARGLYASFMDDALQHPDMYGGVWSAEAHADKRLAAKYSYFIGKFLWAAEEILRCHSNDENWKETVRVTLREHVDYLRSDDFVREVGGYPKHLNDLIDEVSGSKKAVTRA